MSASYPSLREDAPLVVFDFDHTLYDGDSGSDLFAWLIRRSPLRLAAALLITPLLGPLAAMLSTRRRSISGYVWIATFGMRHTREFNTVIRAYVLRHESQIRQRLLPQALEVFACHRMAGDCVVVATGAPPELVRAILALVAYQEVPVVGSSIVPRFGAIRVARHCHHEEKIRMLREQGYRDIAVAYSDSTADLPLLMAAKVPVVVNPKPKREKLFRRLLPPGTSIIHWGCRHRGGDCD
ncbi:MAG TPA: haloacid dehalogenase-like hydrolase [Xylella taiwanensis]